MKTLKPIQIFTKIFKILTTIAIVCCFIGLVGLVLGGSCMLFIENNPAIKEEYFKIIYMENSAIPYLEPKTLATIIFAIIPMVIGAIVVLFFANEYLKHELNRGTPFTYEGASEILRLAIISLSVTLGCYIITCIILFANGITNELNVTIDLTSGVILLFLHFVYKHGAELAQTKINDNADTIIQDEKIETTAENE